MFKVLYKVTSGPLCIISAKSIKQKRKADKLYVNSLSCVINCSPNCEQFIRHLNIWKKNIWHIFVNSAFHCAIKE